MFRAASSTLSRRGAKLARFRLASTVPATSTTSSVLPVPKYSEVKFLKEDVNAVMAELPEFNFYEMPEEMNPNPYQATTLDRSILLGGHPEAVPVKPEIKFAKLENGLKVAAVDNGGLTAHIGLYVNAGSRYETSANFGVSHMVSLMGYKSTAHLSHLRTVKTLEQLGAQHTATCTASQEEVAYEVAVPREFMPLVVPLLVGNVLFPRLLPWEVKAAQKQVKEAQEALKSSPDAMVSALLHKAAYTNNTLGIPTLASERSMSYFTPETIRSFMLDHFAPERMVLVGVNVNPEELNKWAMRAFADYNAIPMKERPAASAKYTGGSLMMDGESQFCHLAIGLESVPFGTAELAPMAILATLLGSGSAVSTTLGGGSMSRLSTQVVKQNPHVESCAAFNTTYSDSGLFGAYGVCQPDKAGDMATAMIKALTGLTKVSQTELTTAKAVLKGKMLRQMDDDKTLMKDLGQQILLGGAYGSPKEFAKMIDAVTATQVTAAAAKLLSGRPTVVAYGDTHAVPAFLDVEAALKA